MLFMCYWRSETERRSSGQACGFIRASSPEEAKKIMQENLQEGYEVAEIIPAKEHWITPQSITVNFANTTDYMMFG